MHEGIPHPKIILVDDDPVDRTRLSALLSKRGYHVIQAEGGEQALERLGQADAPRIAVVDWNMASINGPELCRILRMRTPYTYVVLMTAREGREPLVEAMRSGADGYLQKPVHPDELEAWVNAGTRIVHLQDNLLKAHAELERRATHDYLTGVYNRRAVIDELSRELQRGARTGSPASVALFDVDHFKEINDTHGHAVGDEVLVEFAKRFVRATRGYDVFGRYGGEEFLFIAPDEGSETALHIAERLLRAVTGREFATSVGPLAIAASAGVASTDQGYAGVAALVSAADKALYRAKAGGRACCRLALPDQAMASEGKRFC